MFPLLMPSLYHKQEESSDESTIISSQTSTLTRNLGPEALRLNLPLTTEDFEHVIDSDDDEEEEEEEEELEEAGQEEAMEEALENAVCFYYWLRMLVFFLSHLPLYAIFPSFSIFIMITVLFYVFSIMFICFDFFSLDVCILLFPCLAILNYCF